jgi:hypothetical protein
MTRASADCWRLPKRNKFGAVKVKLDGHTFDSKAEAKRYGELKLLERAHKIRRLQVHPRFDIHVNGRPITRYTADFLYEDIYSREYVEDVKSEPTAAKRDFKLVCKLMKAVHGIDVQVIGGKPSSRPSMRADAERHLRRLPLPGRKPWTNPMGKARRD